MKNKTLIYPVFLTGLLLSLVLGCNKETHKSALSVSIKNVTNIKGTTADVIISAITDGTTITEQGVCWSTSPNPTIDDHKTVASEGNFTIELTGLTPGQTYFIKAYAIGPEGTVYSSQSYFIALALVPVITNTQLLAVHSTKATVEAIISSDGGTPITSHGVRWRIQGSPVYNYLESPDSINGAGVGSFLSNLSGLNVYSWYYVQAYATNRTGTAYGNEVLFRTLYSDNYNGIAFNPRLTYGTVTDIDGNVYKTIQIGTQIWMAENLKTTMYRNGDKIAIITDNTTWSKLTSGAYCWYNNEETIYKNDFGALYNWYAVIDSRNIAPSGWHVATDSDWSALIAFLGGEYEAAGKLKETGINHWLSADPWVTNESGFTALPGGDRTENGTAQDINYYGLWWIHAGNNQNSIVQIECEPGAVRPDVVQKAFAGIRDGHIGLSVRCVKD